jgi:hypothetical protein
MDLYLSLVVGVLVALLLTPSLRVHYTAPWHWRGCLKACLIACLIACLGAYLREPGMTQPGFGSRVFHRKLFTK